MRFFPLFDAQLVFLLSFLGLAALVLLYIALSKSDASTGQEKGEDEKEEYPEGIQSTRKPIPVILIFIYGGFIIWAVAYVIVIGIRGKPF